MKFLNLDTGYSFDGLWEDSQSKGYIFWFPGEQSTDIIYSMPICIIADDANPLTLSIDENDVFSFIEHANITTTVDGYEFDTPLYSNVITSVPETVNGHNIHVVNVICSSKDAGEFICKVKINDVGFIKIGADFYGEYEPAYINLSNMGVEIPDTVQKAIYDSNVHEDMTDNILINRKLKELLSNYWDVVANRGSYKSLLNALKWFEWDDSLTIREIWKRTEADHAMFDDRELLSIFENKLNDSFDNFVKTTYVSLYCSMQDELDTYDDEYNPELAAAVFKWSRNDIQLKIAILAQFFGIYFLPIHMSILHATAEDKVFTNALKTIYGTDIKRDDCIGNFDHIECNIKDGSTFRLSNVRTQVGDDTFFGIKYPDTNSLGVDIFPSSMSATDIKTFANQYYSGPGVVIPIEIIIPNQSITDMVTHTSITSIIDDKSYRFKFDDVIKARGGKIKLNFNVLAKTAGEHIMNFAFILGSGDTVTRSVRFNVDDPANISLNIYKVRAKDDTNGLTKEDFTDTSLNEYFFRIQTGSKSTDDTYVQYMPYMSPTDERYSDYKGVKLSRTVIVDLMNNNGLGKLYSDHEILFLRSVMMKDYLEYAKYQDDANGNKIMTYLIFVSKKFFAELPNDVLNNVYNYKYNIIRNDLGFYPQFHYLERMDGLVIDNYTVSQYEAVCCAAELESGNKVLPLRYGNDINSVEWTFINQTDDSVISLPTSSRRPFIAGTDNAVEQGYYTVRFKYSLTDDVERLHTLESAFRIKNI